MNKRQRKKKVKTILGSLGLKRLLSIADDLKKMVEYELAANGFVMENRSLDETIIRSEDLDETKKQAK